VYEDAGDLSTLERAWRQHGEKIRYLAVGAWNTLFGYLLFLFLLAALGPALQTLESSSLPPLQWIGHAYYLVVGWIGWVFAVPQSTVTMKFFVFRSRGNLLHEVWRAYFIYLPAQGLGTVILWFMVQILGMPPPIGALTTIAGTTVFSYIGHKYFTFRKPLEVGEVYDEDLLEPQPPKTDS
jgi:putative flippase GtrA